MLNEAEVQKLKEGDVVIVSGNRNERTKAFGTVDQLTSTMLIVALDFRERGGSVTEGNKFCRFTTKRFKAGAEFGAGHLRRVILAKATKQEIAQHLKCVAVLDAERKAQQSIEDARERTRVELSRMLPHNCWANKTEHGDPGKYDVIVSNLPIEKAKKVAAILKELDFLK